MAARAGRRYRLGLRRLGWLVLLWAGSVLSLGALAGAMKLFMRWLGLH